MYIYIERKIMKAIYYYSNGCGCCKGYREVVERVCERFNLVMEPINIDNERVEVELRGVPTLILTDDEGIERYRSIGNLREQYLLKAMEELMDGKGGE